MTELAFMEIGLSALIVVSLVAIFVQLRRSQYIATADLNRATASPRAELMHRLQDNPDLALKVRVALQRWHDLPNDDKLSVHIFWSELMNQYDALRELEARGLAQGSEFQLLERSILGLLVTPGGEAWWKEAKALFKSEVREHLAAKLYYSHEYPAWTEFSGWVASEEDYAAALNDTNEVMTEPRAGDQLVVGDLEPSPRSPAEQDKP